MPLQCIQPLMLHMLPLFSVLKDLKYADTHEWVKVEGDSATVGITDHAQVNTLTYFYCCEFRCEAILGVSVRPSIC
jgi:hypothetical protein